MNRIALVTFGALLALACKEDDPCDATTYYVDRTCRAIPVDAAAGVDAASGDSLGPDRPTVGPVNFGATCRDHIDCMGAMSACFIQPNQTMGFCSAIDCDKVPGICPMSWTCCDLSKIRPGSPWGCIPLAVCP